MVQFTSYFSSYKWPYYVNGKTIETSLELNNLITSNLTFSLASEMKDFVEQKTNAFITLGLADGTLILYFNFHWPSKGCNIFWNYIIEITFIYDGITNYYICV